jgi:hypothetical protein
MPQWLGDELEKELSLDQAQCSSCNELEQANAEKKRQLEKSTAAVAQSLLPLLDSVAERIAVEVQSTLLSEDNCLTHARASIPKFHSNPSLSALPTPLNYFAINLNPMLSTHLARTMHTYFELSHANSGADLFPSRSSQFIAHKRSQFISP